MKRKNFVKLTAMATAAAMAVSPVMVFAAESADGDTTAGSTINGSGDLEDFIKKEVFKVVLPTNGDANFKLDPQGLLKVANSTKYALGAGAVYFANKQSDGSFNYSNTSDPIDIINKSSYDIDVDFSVEVTLPEGVTMVESDTALANATTPSVYLAMKEGNGTATALKSGNNTAATKTVTGVAEDTTHTAKEEATGYLITATPKETGDGYTYKYELGGAFVEANAAKASYTLTGSCDTKADWAALKDKSVSTKIVWSAKKHENFTDGGAASGNWGTDGLWLSKDASTGFANSSLTVEVSEDGTAYTALTSSQYTVSDLNWVCVTWDGIVAGLGNDPAGTYYVRITDGTTRYTYEQQ